MCNVKKEDKPSILDQQYKTSEEDEIWLTEGK